MESVSISDSVIAFNANDNIKSAARVLIRLTHNHEEYTTEALIDKLTVNLGSIKTEIIPADTPADPIKVSKYYRQASRLMYWLPMLKVPSNEFVINISDLQGKIRHELKGLDSKTLQYVLKQSVTKIFENIDADAYHSRSLGKNLRVRLEA